jgi:hypothetical protein
MIYNFYFAIFYIAKYKTPPSQFHQHFLNSFSELKFRLNFFLTQGNWQKTVAVKLIPIAMNCMN